MEMESEGGLLFIRDVNDDINVTAFAPSASVRGFSDRPRASARRGRSTAARIRVTQCTITLLH